MAIAQPPWGFERRETEISAQVGLVLEECRSQLFALCDRTVVY